MSIEIMTMVFKKSKTRGAARLVLLSLADTASDEGECYPSIKTIALKAGLGEQTTRQYMHLFTLMGLIKTTARVDDNARQTSNRYKINVKKIGDDFITGEMIAEVRPPSHRLRPPLSHTYPPPSMAVIPSPSVAVIDESSINPQKEPSYYPLARALSEVCGMDYEANRGRLFKEAKLLSKALPLPTVELIIQHYNGDPSAFWKSTDWRGQKGQRPTPSTIRETWGQWQASSSINPMPADPGEIDRLNREEIERFNRVKAKSESRS